MRLSVGAMTPLLVAGALLAGCGSGGGEGEGANAAAEAPNAEGTDAELAHDADLANEAAAAEAADAAASGNMSPEDVAAANNQAALQ